MAKPIEPTPLLTGKAAEVFLKRAASPKPFTRPMLDVAEISKKIQAISKSHGK